MGQCYGKCLGRRRRQYRHKRFQYAPKRSWKYKDATLLNEFHEMSMEASENTNQDGSEDNIETDVSLPVANGNREAVHVDSEEEEIDTGEIRMSGRLVFSEEEFNSDIEQDDISSANSPTPLQVAMITEEKTVDLRERTSSAGSEQIGRFEVMDVDEFEAASEPLMSKEGHGRSSSVSSSNSHSRETSKLVAHVHQANVT